MAPTSYLKRVQQTLHDLVNDYQLVVTVDLLNIRILGPVRPVNERYRSRSESRIRVALNREVRSRRVKIDHEQHPALVTVTSDGEKFYRAFGSDPVYKDGDARLMRLTVPQLHRQAEAFKLVLEDIQDTFIEFYPNNTDAQSLTTLPDAIKDFYNALSELEYTNTELQLNLNYEEGRGRRAREAGHAVGQIVYNLAGVDV